MNLARYCIAVMLIVAIPAAILFWLLVHPFARFWRKLGTRKSYICLCSLLLVAMFLMFRVRESLLTIDWGTNWPLAAIGGVLLAVSGYIRRLLASELPIAVLVGIPELSSDRGDWRMITSGLYSRVRHPRYLQMDLALFGYALIANYPAAYAALILWMAGIRVVAFLEERELIGRFGEQYLEYARRVPGFIPRLRKGSVKEG